MLLTTVLSLLLPFAAAVPRRPRDLDLVNRTPCPSGAHIIACSGHGGLPHQYGLLQSTVASILTAIPGSNNYSVPYPKKSDDRPEGIAVGVQMLTSVIANYTDRCPETPIILLGYSEGAIVTMNTLCGRSHLGAPYSPSLPASYAQYIMATVVYGDETRVPNQSYDRGTCKVGQGVDARGNPDGCAAFEDNVRSYCDEPDPECCGGTKRSAHFQYPKKYDGAATRFLAKRYRDFIAAKET